MSQLKDRIEHLEKEVSGAAAQLASAEEGQWPAERRKQAEAALAYMQLVLVRTDPSLLSEETFQGICGVCTTATDNPASLFESFEEWMSRVVNFTSRLPAAQDREFEQVAKDAATKFQRSAQQRFAAVERRVNEAKSEAATLVSDLEARRAEIAELVEQTRTQLDEATSARLAQIDTRTQEIQTAAERHAERLDTLATEQAETFRKAQEERAEEHRAREQAYEAQMSKIEAQAHERTSALIADIEEMKTKSSELVGAIGITGTAERYGQEFEEQRAIADRWRRGTVVVGIFAACAAVLAAFDHNTTTAGAKLAIAILIGGVGFYTARQSAHHRCRGTCAATTTRPHCVPGVRRGVAR